MGASVGNVGDAVLEIVPVVGSYIPKFNKRR